MNFQKFAVYTEIGEEWKFFNKWEKAIKYFLTELEFIFIEDEEARKPDSVGFSVNLYGFNDEGKILTLWSSESGVDIPTPPRGNFWPTPLVTYNGSVNLDSPVVEPEV